MKRMILCMLLAGAAGSLGAQVPANPANPYDDAGGLHNEVVNYVLERLPATNRKKATVELMDDWMKEHKVRMSVVELLSDPDFQALHSALRGNGDPELVLVEMAGFSAAGAAYYSQLKQALRRNGYDEVYEAMVDAEAAILADRSLPESERQTLLASASVGRQSAWNWQSIGSAGSTDAETAADADMDGATAAIGNTAALPPLQIGPVLVPGWLVAAVIGGAWASINFMNDLNAE